MPIRAYDDDDAGRDVYRQVYVSPFTSFEETVNREAKLGIESTNTKILKGLNALKQSLLVTQH